MRLSMDNRCGKANQQQQGTDSAEPGDPVSSAEGAKENEGVPGVRCSNEIARRRGSR